MQHMREGAAGGENCEKPPWGYFNDLGHKRGSALEPQAWTSEKPPWGYFNDSGHKKGTTLEPQALHSQKRAAGAHMRGTQPRGNKNRYLS